MTNSLRRWSLFGSFLLCLLPAMQAQANRCGDSDIYRGGSYHEQPFTLVELGGAKEKQLEQIFEQFSGQWLGDGLEVQCRNKGSEKRLSKIEGSGDGDESEAQIRLSKKHKNGSSNALLKLFLKDGLLRYDRPNFTNLELSSLSKDTLEFSVREGGVSIRHSYWRIQLSKKVGSRYRSLKIEKSVYSQGGLIGAERWNLKRF